MCLHKRQPKERPVTAAPGGMRRSQAYDMNPTSAQGKRANALRVFNYLAETDELPAAACDAVLGFGVFDLKLPRFCGELYRSGRAKRIIFTGGVGAGSADLGQPEADAWHAELLKTHPCIPRDHIILENRSTNTGENVRFTAELLAQKHPRLAFGVVRQQGSRFRRAPGRRTGPVGGLCGARLDPDGTLPGAAGGGAAKPAAGPGAATSAAMKLACCARQPRHPPPRSGTPTAVSAP